MTTLTVNTRDFQDALTALAPFLSKNGKDKDRVERGEFILCTIASTGRLLLTAYQTASYWAIATVALENFDGEVTDFAIHYSDIGVITGAFPKARVDDSVSLTIEHYNYESKKLQGDKLVTEYKRDTRIRLDEVGQLFGSRSAQFAGADARSHSAAEMWANAEGILTKAGGTPPHFFEPQTLKYFAKAANIYGIMIAAYTNEEIVARAKNFVGCAPLPWKPDGYTPPPHTKEWAQFIAHEIPLAPDHTVYAA
ncbi:hypothetical protein [Rothia nasimurium]|uniref:hypothetical protein n=1 Tax=Rothia nasimurium TaxID=85336 RepID=UPI001F343D76|nr:hypothetical protein [Rothia nasimurium]